MRLITDRVACLGDRPSHLIYHEWPDMWAFLPLPIGCGRASPMRSVPSQDHPEPGNATRGSASPQMGIPRAGPVDRTRTEKRRNKRSGRVSGQTRRPTLDCKCLIFLGGVVRPGRFERPTFCSGGKRSMGIRAFVSIQDVQNSRFRPILGQLDLTRRHQARFKPIKDASNQRNICLGLPSPEDSVGCGHVSGDVGCHCVPCQARFRACQNPSPNLRSCRIASCERDRLCPRGSAAATTKISLDLSVPAVFLVPSFGSPLRRRALKFQRRPESGNRQTDANHTLRSRFSSPSRKRRSRGTAVDDKRSLVP